MSSEKSVGLSLGFLGGTTLGSGISFLLGGQAYYLILLVSIFGAAGALLGLRMSRRFKLKG